MRNHIFWDALFHRSLCSESHLYHARVLRIPNIAQDGQIYIPSFSSKGSFLIVRVQSLLSRSVCIFLFVCLLPESSFLILFGDLNADFLFPCCSVLLSDLIHFEASSTDVLPWCCFAVSLAVSCVCLTDPLDTPSGTTVDTSLVVPLDLTRQLRMDYKHFGRNFLFPSCGCH